MMIQKKIKKWYPTKERELEVKKQEENRAMVQRMIRASEQMNRLAQNSRYGSANYVVTSPEVARALQNVQYGNMGDLYNTVGYTTTELEPKQESVKPSTWQMFKEDFGEWKWSNFWFKLIIFGVLSLVFSISHRLINGPLKLNDGNFCPFYLEILFAQMLHLGVASLFWVLEKLWYIKAYITSFIKLGITFILVFPLALVLSFLPMNYKETKSISEKITDFWGEKCFTKKEGEIIDKYIKEL
jgi:hypothetical protein